MNSEKSQAALVDFRRQLEETKKLRIDGVSMDFWWGLIEKEQGKFNFDYYHKLTDEVIKAGLDVTGVMSFHQCGGNVGDTENIKIPQWVWKDIAQKFGSTDTKMGMYKSEQGHYSEEYIQPWADNVAKDYYADTIKAFRDSFAAKAPYFSEVNVSLGPSGEMRFPSYNSHDTNVGYPTRGAMQAYSDMAVSDFQRWALDKYGDISKIGSSWNIQGLTLDHVQPPDNTQVFFDSKAHLNTQYGRDLIDWYNESLVKHGKVVLSEAQKVIGAPGSPFAGTPIGAKVPGVHWRMGWKNGDVITYSDRAAETNAGLIQTSSPWAADNAYGYKNILNMFKDLQPKRPGTGSPVIPSYTCLELNDGQDGPDAQSLPHTAALRFGEAASKMGLQVDAENALSGTLYSRDHWDAMTGLIRTPLDPNNFYSKLTLLRMHDVVDNQIGREKVSGLIDRINAQPATAVTAEPESTIGMPVPIVQNNQPNQAGVP